MFFFGLICSIFEKKCDKSKFSCLTQLFKHFSLKFSQIWKETTKNLWFALYQNWTKVPLFTVYKI